MTRLLRGAAAQSASPAAVPDSGEADRPSSKPTSASSSSTIEASISSPSIEDSSDSRRSRRSTAAPSAEATPANTAASRRFQLEVSECVETKTVTTTTRRTRKFPSVYVRDPLPLSKLDVREYPLAMKETPAELTDLSYTEDETLHDIRRQENELKLRDMMMQEFEEGRTEAAYRELIRQGKGRSLFGLENLESPTQVNPPSTTPVRRSSRHLSASPGDALVIRQDSSPLSAGTLTATAGPSRTRTGTGAEPTSRSRNNTRSTRPLRSTMLQSLSERSRQKQPELDGDDTGSILPKEEEDAADDKELGAYEDDHISATGDHQSPRLGSRSSRAPSSVPAGYLSRAQRPASPAGSDSPTIFSSNVATPPITDAEGHLSSDEEADNFVHTGAGNETLPSPRLSPRATQHQSPADSDDDLYGADDTERALQRVAADGSFYGLSSVWADDSQATESIEGNELVPAGYYGNQTQGRVSTAIDTNTLLEAFDSMRTEMKTYMMYQFLRRCPRPTLRVIFNTVKPTLKCDFLKRLPLELSYTVLSFLDVADLCNAAQVSKQWRNIVDRNETGWRDLFDRDGLVLPPGELNRAIKEGWGWQDPVGPNSCEEDLSMASRLSAKEPDADAGVPAPLPRLRSSKRKRSAYSTSERAKRRALSQVKSEEDALSFADHKNPDDNHVDVKLIDVKHKSEGPLSAASAAAAAVPDPEIGLPTLRQLHLYKSLYRRHHMIRQSWTNGKVRPSHLAFEAHPRHVITCLQFDDDKIITGSDDTQIHIYDTKSGRLRKQLSGHEGGVWALQYEGNILVSGSTDRSVRVWDIEKGLCQQVFYGHTSTVRCLQILMPTDVGANADGTRRIEPEQPLIITGSRDSQLRVWRLPEAGSRRYIQTGPPAQESDCPYFIRVLTGHTHSVRAIAAHGDTLVSGSYDSTVRVWQISTGRCVHVLSGHAQKVYSVVLDKKRNRCISGSMDSLVKIWDLDTGACLYTLEGHTMLVGLLDLKDDRLVSAAADSTLRIWDPANGRCKHMLMAHTGAITCFEHDGRKVISGSERTVKMWDVRTGDCVQDLLTDLRGVWQVRFDQRRCVAAVQRGELTYVEILDFGAVRDGYPTSLLGKRIQMPAPSATSNRAADE